MEKLYLVALIFGQLKCNEQVVDLLNEGWLFMKKVLCPGESLIDFVSMDVGETLKGTNGFIKKAGGAPANVDAAI